MASSRFLLSLVVVATLGVACATVLRGGGGDADCENVTCAGVEAAMCNTNCCDIVGPACKTRSPDGHSSAAEAVVDDGSADDDSSNGFDFNDEAESEYIVVHGGGIRMQELANDVAEQLGAKIAGRVADPPCYAAGDEEKNERDGNWDSFGITVGAFSNGSPEILIRPDLLENKNVVFITNINKPAEDFAQLSTLYTLQRIPRPAKNEKHMHGGLYEYVYPKSLTVIVPNLPVARMERVSRWSFKGDGMEKADTGTVVDVATARTMAGLLSARPPAEESGRVHPKVPSRILFIDIHEFNEMARFLTDTGAWDNEWSGEQVMDLTTGKGKYFVSVVPDFMEEHKAELEDTVIAFPDDGAFNRFNEMLAFKGHRARKLMAYCSKKRTIDKIKLVYDPKSPVRQAGGIANKDVLIIDDFTSSGSTLIASTAAMLEQGAKSVSIFVIHPVFDGQGYKKFFDPEKWSADALAKLKKVWVTNSIPMNAYAAEQYIRESSAEEFGAKFSVVKGSTAKAIATWIHDNVAAGPAPIREEHDDAEYDAEEVLRDVKSDSVVDVYAESRDETTGGAEVLNEEVRPKSRPEPLQGMPPSGKAPSLDVTGSGSPGVTVSAFDDRP